MKTAAVIACWLGFALYVYLKRPLFHGPASD
jgi:hypothetical protein